MSYEIANNLQRQEDEVAILSSIFDETEFFYTKSECIKCSISISPNCCRKLKLKFTDNCPDGEEAVADDIFVEHLPPIKMYMYLPNTYPSETPPDFCLSITWLTPWEISFICQRFDEMWRENQGNEIIFLWLSFLQNDIFDFLKIEESLDVSFLHLIYKSQNIVLSRLVQLSDPRAQNGALSFDVKRLLITYDKKQHKVQFRKNVYTCHICFEECLGQNCIELEICEHVYCKNCMEKYVAISIGDSNNAILCPTTDCRRKISDDDVKTLCPDLFHKYEQIMLRVTLNTMEDIVYCPRISCQYPVIRNPNDDAPICPVCNYCFCVFCRQSYHGQESCEMTSAYIAELTEKYKNSNDKEKKMLEKKYGKRQMQIVERCLTTEYLKDNAKSCPKCHSFISKTDGCNKMTCAHCQAFFCWLCNKQIYGYEHFNSADSPCFGLLFEGMQNVMDYEDNIEELFEQFNF
ncbi:PREDICTED: E3 ubiquitin-protein ligase RNF14-like [Vollenhovia emeryi]|uniref:E3 ubiquitin-protein ligase RNF14-like n=1 Tax=Vollenhovia emeryi TaxID=411798 RepID=UPI0005F51AEC|nr:PREDICTED: E3 ubiquitin-protein ligase RNF14-like [Vollenhovia emeryi]XP_011863493.1 PREDICTED: E3 ubiquitin-protein ligase RNF14-like [Vollenhovia emeryi]XP_011863494.1 PREDICTED: E3 ubiquitin-protein ligase RNF14-like [Vollenhovia emeryi]XP_011863495.1 PREDICTED: E3 ubiquitin-protein ligase RNF14-like [Vollenhovia emeryi]XP_011863496.1 PREDICTED: E3 ubiquitin-protein ligase RNF14-like [Vollenhovia emeryi]XP_011863497.1 PREDICTED: E3 ubiquitin-protein ligase RNF14-like [Vollenhovia emeryi]